MKRLWKQTHKPPLTRDPPGASPGLEMNMEPRPQPEAIYANDMTLALAHLDGSVETIRTVLRARLPMGDVRGNLLSRLEDLSGDAASVMIYELERSPHAPSPG